MTKRISPEMVAAYLREIGIDYLPGPPRGGTPAPGAKPAASTAGDAAAETLEDIRKELLSCRGCPLCDGRRTVVFGVGNPRARLMFIGEGPGEEEDRQGEPFVGAAGRRLNQWIARLGIAREDVYIANIVKCRPPGNRAPLPEEAASCLPYLKRQIRAIRPEAVCTLGAVALQYLLGTGEKITRVRGKWREVEGIPVLPTYHPAFILRNQARESEAFEDLDLLAERLHLK
ncbi:MAG: uracil-DNA glycosylase [Deltaproteobacteria bacterium]